MTAYHSGMLAQVSWKDAKIPLSFSDWRDKMLGKARPISAADRFAAFAALADQGFAVTVSETVN